MELSILKKPELVVALDIGSTYSGYAWQWRRDFENNRSNIEFNTQWGMGALQLHKTTTCLLLDKDKNVNSLGHLAEQRYCNQCDRTPNDIHNNWYFFKRFKLLLYRESFKEDILIDDQEGQILPLFDVMTKFIGALKDHFLENLRDKGQTVNIDTTLWVVTVPAIWSDNAKKFMRDAAEKSGIKRKNLLLALEPEAAALYCIHLPTEQKMTMNNVGAKGDKFLTVDLGGAILLTSLEQWQKNNKRGSSINGVSAIEFEATLQFCRLEGGTVDISAIEVLEDGMLKEMCAGAGNLVGGQDVNNAFFQACKDVFVGNAWHEQKNAEDLLTMEADFENKKVAIGSSKPIDEDIILHIPHSMVDLLKSGKLTLRKKVPEAENQFKEKKGKFMFSSAYIRETLFQETITRILQSIKEVMDRKEVKEVKTVVLVGGFAESQIVVEKIKAMLGDSYPDIRVVVPTSPFRAVLKGAVLFGHDPLIFRSRVSRATYGVKSNSAFDPENHDESKKWRNTERGKDYCKDIFDIHVKKDQSVILNDEQTPRIYNPLFTEQKSVTLAIFASNSRDPKYTTDEGCKRLATVEVDMPDTSGGTSREIVATMIYGGTELSVITVDKTTGKEFMADIRFDRM